MSKSAEPTTGSVPTNLMVDVSGVCHVLTPGVESTTLCNCVCPGSLNVSMRKELTESRRNSVRVIAREISQIVVLLHQGFNFNPPWLETVKASTPLTIAAIAIPLLAIYAIHLFIRNKLVNGIAKKLNSDDNFGNIENAFRKNTRWRHSIFSTKPVGWSMRIRKKLDGIRSDIDQYVQKLNDQYTSPAGKSNDNDV